MPHFFISHSESEDATARRLADFLRSHGFEVWINTEGVPASVNFLKDVEHAIRRSEFLIVVWSPDAPKSRWMRLEIDIAQSLSKRIIPVAIGEGNKFEILTDGKAITLSDPEGLAQLKQLFTPASEIIHPPRLEDRPPIAPRRSTWPIFLFGVITGFFAVLGAWLWLTQNSMRP
jgi:hypothetical protein